MFPKIIKMDRNHKINKINKWTNQKVDRNQIIILIIAEIITLDFHLLRWYFKLMLARWHSWPMKSLLFENQPIRGCPQIIKFENRP